MVSKVQSPLTPQALAYTWRQLARRVGIKADDSLTDHLEMAGVPVYYTRSDQLGLTRPGITIVPCDHAAWNDLLKRQPDSLDWFPGHDTMPHHAQPPVQGPVPVLFWGEDYEDGKHPFVEQRGDGSIVFYADIVAATFFMLSRWEETVVQERDTHQRFPAVASVAYKQRFLDRPVVDEFALILREWLKIVLPGCQPEAGRFSVKLSHDIDVVGRPPDLRRAGRRLAGDLLKRRNVKKAWQTSVNIVRQLGTRDAISYFPGIHLLAQLSKLYGLESVFYFMAPEPGSFGSSYDLKASFIKRCIVELRHQGFEIGLHAGYDTFNNPERLAVEKARLDRVLGDTQYGGRQHYLRFQVPDTWLHWEQVGLTYDSTLTYADFEGFRCGTCHPFRPFDVKQNRELDLWEIPLIVTDGTLRQYRQMTPEEGEARILELAQRCKQVEGTFTLLWHNSSLDGEWSLWARVYRRVVEALSEMKRTS